jgi:hypothetical protein
MRTRFELSRHDLRTKLHSDAANTKPSSWNYNDVRLLQNLQMSYTLTSGNWIVVEINGEGPRGGLIEDIGASERIKVPSSWVELCNGATIKWNSTATVARDWRLRHGRQQWVAIDNGFGQQSRTQSSTEVSHRHSSE